MFQGQLIRYLLSWSTPLDLMKSWYLMIHLGSFPLLISSINSVPKTEGGSACVWSLIWFSLAKFCKSGGTTQQLFKLTWKFLGLIWHSVKVGFSLKSKLKSRMDQITTFKFSRQQNWACARALLSQSLSWLPLFVWVLSFNSQLGGPIFSVWFCLWSGNKNKVTAVHRVISYLALVWHLY